MSRCTKLCMAIQTSLNLLQYLKQVLWWWVLKCVSTIHLSQSGRQAEQAPAPGPRQSQGIKQTKNSGPCSAPSPIYLRPRSNDATQMTHDGRRCPVAYSDVFATPPIMRTHTHTHTHAQMHAHTCTHTQLQAPFMRLVQCKMTVGARITLCYDCSSGQHNHDKTSNPPQRNFSKQLPVNVQWTLHQANSYHRTHLKDHNQG